MLEIEVESPLRTDDRYEFRCRVRTRRTRTQRVLRRRPTPQRAGRHEVPGAIRFGFRSAGRRIEHHPVWDAVYPLFFLTRFGGPLFDTSYTRATIRFDFPIPVVVRDYYIQRASDMGTTLDVEARTTGATFDGASPGGVVLAFGGGKDSRLLLGVLRELGDDPTVATTGRQNVPDLPAAIVTQAVDGALVDRLMPGLMMGGSELYLGGGLGEAHHVTPWHRYYDMAAPAPLGEMSAMLGMLGLPTRLLAPLVVLPYNVTQRILAHRYPELHRHQHSVRDGQHSEKNLHVTLCRYHHAIPLGSQCSRELFVTLLEEYITRQTEQAHPFGARDHREVIDREMRAIIHRHRDEPMFRTVRPRVPDHWAGDWIDYTHDYVQPDPRPAGFPGICAEYARPIDEAPPEARLRRIPVDPGGRGSTGGPTAGSPAA
jgi:hypothetical protein